MKNFYEVLRVRTNATQSQIKKAYIELITKYHPDVYKGDKEYAARYTSILTEAYAALKDEDHRRDYDARHFINQNPNWQQLKREDKYIKEEKRQERKMPRQNYEQQMSSKYFKNAERKRESGILKKIFTSKLFYCLIIIILIEAGIILYAVIGKNS